MRMEAAASADEKLWMMNRPGAAAPGFLRAYG